MWIIRLEYLLGWQRLPLFGRYWYVEMTRFQRLKFFSYAGYVPVHNFAPFMVVSSTCEEPQPVYEGVYTVEGHGEGYFYPTWMTL
jgi:hypothetical protein